MKVVILEKISSIEVNPCLEESNYPNIESLEANLDDSIPDIVLSIPDVKQLRDALTSILDSIETDV
jgi:hypothetical protein